MGWAVAGFNLVLGPWFLVLRPSSVLGPESILDLGQGTMDGPRTRNQELKD